uniref:Uncharacterized protein n=2 Tax=Peronospora matthiolae TaxID=2874970 RepID=A0AAV1V3E3_9STRA
MDLWMHRMEASQARMDEDERMRGTQESELYRSNNGAELAGKLHYSSLELMALHDRHFSSKRGAQQNGSKI